MCERLVYMYVCVPRAALVPTKVGGGTGLQLLVGRHVGAGN